MSGNKGILPPTHTLNTLTVDKERGTTPKARGASRAGEEHEQRVHGGRLESARDDTSMKKRQSRFQSEARTVNDCLLYTSDAADE